MIRYKFYVTEKEKVQGYKHERGINIKIAADKLRQRVTILSHDTELRIALHKEIMTLAREGKSVVEIVRKLNTMEEYSKYAEYFVGYAENAVSKVAKLYKPKVNDENDSDER